MVKQKSKFNIFDLLILVAVALLCFIFAVSLDNRPNLGSKAVIVEVRVTDKISVENAIDKIAATKKVFYSSTKYMVDQLSYQVERDSAGNLASLTIKLKGPGEIRDNNSIFNGQRIYVNQKVEIRSDYFVQGYVADYYEE
jgi:hypothetical protein